MNKLNEKQNSLSSGHLPTSTSSNKEQTRQSSSPKKVIHHNAKPNYNKTNTETNLILNENNKTPEVLKMSTNNNYTKSPPPILLLTENDALLNRTDLNSPNSSYITTLCFICELPILAHQSWNTWLNNNYNNNNSSIGLLSTSENSAFQPNNNEYSNNLNNIYHEDCLSCYVCNVRLKPGNEAKRHANHVYCLLHYVDVSDLGSGGEEFMTKLRDFKRQSLGCAETRRKSSTTLTFPVPAQACPGQPYCSGFPHFIKQTSGYWIECCGGSETVNYDHKTNYTLNNEIKTQDLKQAHLSSTSGIPRSNTSSDVFQNKLRLERNDTSKSTNNMMPMNMVQLPTICIENLTHDDVEIFTKKQPNIIISLNQKDNSPGFSQGETVKGQEEKELLPDLKSKLLNQNEHLEQLKLVHKQKHQEMNTFNGIENETFILTETSNSQQQPKFNLPTSMPPAKNEKKEEFELISFQEEIYEKYFYGKEHWNYFTCDDGLGAVIISLKQEIVGNQDQFRVLLRTVSYTLHGLVSASSICADRYDREAVVRAFSNEAGLKPSLTLGQLPSTPDDLLKLDQVFVKSELKVGVLYIKHGQTTEESILDNKQESIAFQEFLQVLGDKVVLKGFDKYKGGLDTVHDLTGKESIYTCYRGIEIMFHVSTMLPHEENDPQKLQKKRHIGNDIVCVVFVESDETPFWPGCIKSNFLHAFIVVRLCTGNSNESMNSPKLTKYKVSVVCRDEVSAFKPYLWHESIFENSPRFRKWLLAKIINGERASYSAPKFARMQDRTRAQMLEDIVNNLANHLATGQIPKPYRRGSWRPIGHMRPVSPLLDSVRDLFEDYDQLSKDFYNAFNMNEKMICDVVFNVVGGIHMFARNNPGHQNATLAAVTGLVDIDTLPSIDNQGNIVLLKSAHCIYCGLAICNCTQQPHEETYQSRRVFGVRAILAIRSRVFLEMFYIFSSIGNSISPTLDKNQLNDNLTNTGNGAQAMKIESQHSPERKGKLQSVKRKRGSITAETMHKIAQIPKIIYPSDSKNKRKESDASISGYTSKPLTYLTVPTHTNSSNNNQNEIGTINNSQNVHSLTSGNSLRTAFTRFVSGNWAGWGIKNRIESIKRWQSESFYNKQENNTNAEFSNLNYCGNLTKINRNKLAQTEFTIDEFDGDTFQLLIEYLHSGTCPLTCSTIPGLICAAEHFDIPDLLQACFHHTKTHLSLTIVPNMLCQLENYYWRYNCASQLASAILKFVDGKLNKLFALKEYLQLSESMLISILNRPNTNLSELKKFKILLKWAQYKVKPNLNFKSFDEWDIIEVSSNLDEHHLNQLRIIMKRLTRDIKFFKMSPQDIIKIVLPSKTIPNEQVLSTLLYQADNGIYCSYANQMKRK